MKRDRRVNGFVRGHSDRWEHGYRGHVVERYGRCNDYYGRWGGYYRGWYRYGFLGGWYYPLYPIYDMHLHFWNPVIFWLYGDVWDDYYYRTWYGSGWSSYPDLQVPFGRPGVFYPTVAMRDLAMGISEMPIREQANFRIGVNDLANRLEQKLSDGLATPVFLGRNDIVVTHYQMLEEAVVLDGFVSADARQFPFKALFDLQDPNANLVFVPATNGTEPSPEQQAELRQLNERIIQLGGSVDDGTNASLK